MSVRQRLWGTSAVMLAAVGAIAVGFGTVRQGAIGQDGPNVAKKEPVVQAQALSTAFRKAAETAMPTVVTIRSKTKAQAVRRNTRPGQGGMPRGGENPFKGTPFEDFFGDGGGGLGEMPGPSQKREGMGSGVIIDKSGIVLTNNHVVEGADEVIVHLPDGREYKAEDIKTDDQTDLAVLRIKNAGSLPAAKLGNSDLMEIGDWVIAIGNPFELEQTVSAGIISGKGRELGSIRRAKFLQTDAAINPGNSGGPLVNLDGEVVGINTAIATNSGSFAGIGFAIPINTAKWVINQLLDKGSVQRAYLGVSIGEISGELAEKFGLPKNSGVLISEVFPNSPAAQAGFQDGDVVTAFAGQKVRNPRDLQELVERAPLDSKQRVDVLRDKKPVSLEVVVKALPKNFGMAERPRTPKSETPNVPSFSAENLGIEVTELAADQAESLGFAGFHGVLVSEVDPNSVAAEHGISSGMLVMKVGKKTVQSVEEFKAAIKGESLKDGILLLVRTRAGNRFVVLQE